MKMEEQPEKPRREDVCPSKKGALDLDAARDRLAEAQGPEYWRSLEELAGSPDFQEMLHREFPKGASEWLDSVSRRGFLKLMHDQPRFKPFARSDFYTDLRSARPPVEGTVARGELREDTYLYTGKIGSNPGDYMASNGQNMFQQLGCSTCHRFDTQGRGPNLVGLFGKPVQLEDGRVVTADENYIRESILTPGAKVVSGFKPIMITINIELKDGKTRIHIARVSGKMVNGGDSDN